MEITWVKENMTSECSDWDTNLEKQDRQNQEIENKKANEGKTPHSNPASLPVTALTFQPPTSTKEWPKKESNGNRCKTLTAGIGHKSSKSLEDLK